jgi:hypothetical protein
MNRQGMMVRLLMEFLPNAMFLAVLCLQSVSASPSGSSESFRGLESSNQGLMSGIRVLYRTYEQCEQQEDMFACLKLKALKFADRALRVKSIQLVDGVELVMKEGVEDSRQLSEPPVELGEADLPVDAEKRHETLDDFLIDRLSRFLTSHTLKLNVPKFVSELGDSSGEKLLEEGESIARQQQFQELP